MHSILRPIPFHAVELHDRFWNERLDTVLHRTIPSQYRQLEQNGYFETLDLTRPAPPLTIPEDERGFTTQIFWDSDIGKWIEAASYALRHERNVEIEAQIDGIVKRIKDAQQQDGYLNLWYQGREIHNRWTNLRDNHELYNAGHLLEGAIAYHQATGKRTLLEVMERFVTHIGKTFGEDANQRPGYPGHQEIELALIKLYDHTGERRHLDLATYFINQRGAQPHYFDQEAKARSENPATYHQKTHQYSQSHEPVRSQRKAVGHSVRAMYMYASMADLAVLNDDEALRRACETLWNDVTRTRMYVTGGFGSSQLNEGFTEDYDLPNNQAYAETCASVAMVFWAHRMANMTLDRKYADVMELALFNGALAGLSQDGERYFYDNKLSSQGQDHRWEWHPCPCCTMNVSRLVASIGQYFYAASNDAVAVHLYGSSATQLELAGSHARVTQTTEYPWDDQVQIDIQPDRPAKFTLQLRLPGWCEAPSVKLNGETVALSEVTQDGYLAITRTWQVGDRVNMVFPMAPKRLYAHPRVEADLGRVALRRGPFIYCIEATDNPGVDVHSVALPRDATLRESRADESFANAVVLKAYGLQADHASWGDALYRSESPRLREVAMTAVPYYLWANREPGSMTVWIREAGLPAAPG